MNNSLTRIALGSKPISAAMMLAVSTVRFMGDVTIQSIPALLSSRPLVRDCSMPSVASGVSVRPENRPFLFISLKPWRTKYRCFTQSLSYTISIRMNVDLVPGKYVVAVSGGVDSISLLHILQAQPGVRLIVAHFDHGIREDSVEDRRLVQNVAREYRLPFVYDAGNLGVDTSEAAARQARYRFLRRVQQASGARAIVTAHHQDDLLETAILNLLRGTGRKGLTALSNRSDMI